MLVPVLAFRGHFLADIPAPDLPDHLHPGLSCSQIPARSVTHLLVVAVAAAGACYLLQVFVHPSQIHYQDQPWLLGTRTAGACYLPDPLTAGACYLPSPLSAIPGLGQPCTPWLTLPGSIPTYAQQAGSSATMRKADSLRNLLGSASRTSSLTH